MAFDNKNPIAPFTVVDANGNVLFNVDTNGVLTVEAANGAKIQIDPTGVLPLLHFFSVDGSNDAFINVVNTGNGNADLGINSGKYTPSDGVQRRTRLYMDDSQDASVFECIDAATQNTLGGKFEVCSFAAFVGYKDENGTDNYARMGNLGFGYKGIDGYDREIVRAPLATFFTKAGTLCTWSSGSDATFTSWDANSSANVLLKNNRVYLFKLAVSVYHNGTESCMPQVRINQVQGNPSSTQLGFIRPILGAEGSNVPGPWTMDFYVKNTTGADRTITPGLSISRISGTSSVALFGDGNLQTRISVYDMGDVGAVPDLAALANGVS